ncbi:NYN domain-containing protein [Janthinobacterium sp. EB271-G4-7A]|uniref:NYN domain-containing protein n=1 Tax=Janthinobacterium sp. EB271-G4-7A TaxID=2775056 RepID=UPI001E4B4374|nr:NYN domain-containing protein [Janthinobacterium sp. EB271-G4-7A]MCC7697092.1 NYN domain-containing protein [Janthinobacterium sp. EB271-G4-7A]
MSRVAVFIDAGYFWVQATHIVLGARGPRTSLTIDYPALHKKVLDEVAAQFPGKDLLRVFWYDGPDVSGSKGPDHLEIDLLDDFKLRIGTRNGMGQQKAVDGMIISDLLTFSQSRAIENAILITGDADLTPGVVSAQALGLRVHLIIIGPHASTSPYLAAEVDRKVIWDPSIVAAFAKPAQSLLPASAGAAPRATPAAPISVENLPASTPAVTSPTKSQTVPPAMSAAAAAQSQSDGAAQTFGIQATLQGAGPTEPPRQPQSPASSDAIVNPEQPSLGSTETPKPTSSAPPSLVTQALILPPLVTADFAIIVADAHARLLAGPNAAILASVSTGTQPLPAIIDRALLRCGVAYAGRRLSEAEKRQLRIAFRALF